MVAARLSADAVAGLRRGAAALLVVSTRFGCNVVQQCNSEVRDRCNWGCLKAGLSARNRPLAAAFCRR